MTAPVYRMWNVGLGDLWACISLLQRTATARNDRVFLSTMSHWGDRRPILTEIINALAINRVDLTDEPPTAELSGFDVWASPAVRTYRQWEFYARERVVAYQFDGESNADEKNPSEQERLQILTYLIEAGFTPVRLGSHLTIQQCVDQLATSALFVGSCSGMSHVAHSVGVPVYLLEYSQPVVTSHRQKQYVLCKGANEFEANVERYLDLLLSLSGQPRRKG